MYKNTAAEIVFNIPELKELIYDFDPTYKQKFNMVIAHLNHKQNQKKIRSELSKLIQKCWHFDLTLLAATRYKVGTWKMGYTIRGKHYQF